MVIWLLIVVLCVIASILFAIDPRRLRVGIVLFAALSLTTLVIIALIFGKLSSPTNEAAAWLLLGIIATGLATLVTLAGFLMFTGVVMMRREARRLPNLLSFLLGFGLVGYVGLGFLAIALNSPGIMIWILFSIPPLGYLGFIFASYLLYAWLYGRFAHRFGGPVSSVIVLGAGLAGDQITPLLANRLVLGRAVFDRSIAVGQSAKMIVSGGQGGDELVAEADAMSAWLVDAGIPVSAILREDTSSSTEENLRYSKALRDQHDIIGKSAVVTNNFHAFRAATLMSRVGLPGYALGAPTAIYYWPTATIREFIALLRDHSRLNAVILGLLCIPFLAFIFASLV